MPAAHCPICFNHFPIGADKPEIVIFPCGHGYCRECTSTMFGRESKSKCPQCRATLHRREGHPVYLELVDSSAHFAATLVEGLDQMNHTTPLISVKKASQKMGKVLHGVKPDDETMSSLLKAVQDFEDRIIPLFTKVHSQKQEIDALRRDLHKAHKDRDHLQGRVNELEPYPAQVDHLSSEMMSAIHQRDEAFRLAEAAKDQFLEEKGNSSEWQRRASEAETDNRRLKDQLERHVTHARREKEKIKKLAKQVESLQKQLADKEATSDATHQGYDGDFSTHEYSRTHSSFSVSSVPMHSPNRSFNDENVLPVELDFQAVPSAQFVSDWQLHGATALLKKQKQNMRRNAGPIRLDRKGNPTTPVQLGPRNIIRVPR